MRFFWAVAVLSLLVSCNDNDIDGVLEVFTAFTLTDEDGYHLSIAEGTYEGDFNYKAHKERAELEIDDVVAGYDRDFMFNVANPADMITLHDMEDVTERISVYLPSSVSGQAVDAEIVVSNTIISKKPPRVYWDRCGAHIGIKGGLVGLLNMNKRERHRHRRGGSIGQYVYTVSSRTKSEISISIDFIVGEETVATFRGAERRKYRDLMWEGECGDYDRPVIRRD